MGVQIAIITIMKIVDLIKKVIAMLYTVAMLLKSVMYWGESFWDNIPHPFCFKKDTPIQLRDGSWKSMPKANLGDVLLNGSEILGVLKLKNANREPYYKIYDSDLSNYIYVTGKHKIRYNDKGSPSIIEQTEDTIKVYFGKGVNADSFLYKSIKDFLKTKSKPKMLRSNQSLALHKISEIYLKQRIFDNLEVFCCDILVVRDELLFKYR